MKKINKKQKYYAISFLALVIFTFLAIYFFVRPGNVETAVKRPQFAFNEKIAPGWWAGENIFPVDTPPSEYKGDAEELKYTNFTVFQGTKSSLGHCFASFLYSDRGRKNESLVLDASRKRAVTGYSDLSLREAGSTIESIRIFNEDIDYTLYSYELVGSSGTDIARGMQLGYVPLDKGYIEVRVNCALTSELDDVKPVLDAVELRRI